jgi:hypothetical protein
MYVFILIKKYEIFKHYKAVVRFLFNSCQILSNLIIIGKNSTMEFKNSKIAQHHSEEVKLQCISFIYY